VNALSLVSLALYLAAAGVFLYVGWRLSLHASVEVGREPWALFGAWWVLIAASRLLSATELVMLSIGTDEVFAFVAVLYADLFLQGTAIACLVAYLLYLRTGDHRVVPATGWYYLGTYVVLLGAFTTSDPAQIEAYVWGVEVFFDPPLAGLVLNVLVSALLVPLLASLGSYLALYRHAGEPTQRYRIALVAGSLFLWIGGVYGAFLVEGVGSPVWPIALDGLGLAAAIAVYLAYFPPRTVRERFGVSGLGLERA
jgi:hypothetical protein